MVLGRGSAPGVPKRGVGWCVGGGIMLVVVLAGSSEEVERLGFRKGGACDETR